MKPKQFFFVMIGAAVLGIGGIGASLYFGNQMLLGEADTVAELQTDRDVARVNADALRKAQEGKESAFESQGLLDTLLPTQKNQETLIADVLYTASAEAGIPISSVSSIAFTISGANPTDLSGTEAFTEVPGVLSYPFTMTISNISYDTFLQLLTEIESNGRLVQIDDLQISPNRSEPGELSSVTLSLKAFLKP